MKGGVNIFKEIKKSRGSSSTVSSRIDDQVGATNIANHFAYIYSGLYNKVELGDRLENISRELAGKQSDSGPCEGGIHTNESKER